MALARCADAQSEPTSSAPKRYPAIEQRAKAEGGEIHRGGETALVNTDVRGRSYACVARPR